MHELRHGRKWNKWFIIGFLMVFSFTGTIGAASKNYSRDQYSLKLSNKYYEIAFDQSNGKIAYIIDKKTKQNISMGNRDNNLWSALLDDGKWISSSAYRTNFSYKWDPAQNKLSLNYQGTGDNALDVTVDIFASNEQSLKLQASVKNHSGSPVERFLFPYQLNILESAVQDALLPMVPGVKLRSDFFTTGKSYDAQYPGVMFADYVGIRSTQGALAVYAQKGELVQPVNIGFAHRNDGYSALVHNYKTWVEKDKTWTSPTVVIRIGQDYPESIAAYRKENGIDQFKSLSEKLGARKQKFFESPLYKMDFRTLRKPFAELKSSVIDQIKVPGLIHPVAFQPVGHDHYYPDFLPPASTFGTVENLADLTRYAQSKGNLVVPYTNFSWWNTDSPTIQNLAIELEEITVSQYNGSMEMETYASPGYVMNFYHDFVKKRIANEHEKLLKVIGFDGIFEDQLGARNAPYDYNANGLDSHDPSTSYFEGVLNHTRALAGNNLMTECAIDRLAQDEVAFMGTNYLWDLLGYRATTADYSEYYPMIGMLTRDKTLLYQHDLAIETWTDDKDMFRWNLAFGYNFSIALNDITNPWLPLVGVFQKHALSRYTDELVTGFDRPGEQVTRTSFVNHKAYANWNSRDSYTQSGHVIAPGGAMVIANDGSLTAGVFTNFNGVILSEGDHYLVEVRSKDDIKIFQPIGANTKIHIKKYSSWPGVKVAAYGYDDKLIAEVDAIALKDDISFDYKMTLSDKKVAYYQLTKNNKPNAKAYPIPSIPDLTITEILWSPTEISVDDAVVFRATVRNNGTGPVPAGAMITMTFQIDGKDAFWSEYFKAPLDAGATVTLNATRGLSDKVWKATAGPHVINAWVDKINKITEINEGNNSFNKNMPTVDEAIEISPGVRKPRSAANLALNKPVESSGATGPAYGERLVNDGFVNTYFESVNDEFPANLTVDLGSVQNFNKIVMKLPPSWETRFQTITILGGNDMENLKVIVDSTEYKFDPQLTNTVNVTFAQTGVRYLQFVFTANTGWPAGQLAELEVLMAK